MLKQIIISLILVFSAIGLRAQQDNIEIIDIPTANSIDLGAYSFSVRLYDEGSLLTRLYYGIIAEGMTLGLSIDAENVIGRREISMRRPYMYIKLPLYKSVDEWPSISMGFDEQGLGTYDEDINEYETDPMGFFIVFTKAGVAPGLNLSFGMNANYSLLDNAEEKVMGFCGLDFMIGPEFMLLAELKEIQPWDSMVNCGAKYFLTPELNFEFSALNATSKGSITERVLRVHYTKVWEGF